jgi:hypothetical protein
MVIDHGDCKSLIKLVNLNSAYKFPVKINIKIKTFLNIT